jgi:PAS domain S-box-containing protein
MGMNLFISHRRVFGMSRLIPTWLRRWCRAFEWSTFARRWSLTMLLAASLQGGMVALAIWGLARSEQDQAQQVELALAQTHPGIVQGLRDVAVDAVRLTYASTYDPDRDRAGQRLHTVTGTGAQELAALRKWVREQPGTAARELRMIDGLSCSLQRVMTDAEEVLLATTPAGRTARQAALWHSVSGYQAQLDDWVRHAQQGDGQHLINQILAEPTSEMYLALLAGSTICLMLTLSRVRRPVETAENEELGIAGEEISLLRDVVENGPVPTHTVDRFGTILWANKAELALLGYRPEEYIGRSVTEFHADPDVLDDVIQRLMHGETLSGRAVRNRAKDGSIKHLLVDSSACFIHGQLHHTRCFSRDVTGLSRLEDAYRTSERRWRTLVGHSPVGIYLANPRGDCTYVNERWSELSGMSATLAAGNGWAGALHPEDRDRVFRDWQAAAEGHRDFTGEYRFQRPDGEIIWLSGHAVPLRDDQGLITEYLGTITDITPLKAAQQSTTDRELKLKAIVDTATDGIVVITPRGIIESVNPAVARLFGYEPAELVGGPVTTLMAAPYREEHDGYLQRYLRTREPRIIGTTREVRCVHKNGTEFPVEISINVLSLADGLRFTGIIHDLTARQQAENAMLESENRFRNMANNAPVMIWKCGPDGARTFFNKRWLDFRGRPMEAELGDGWMTGLHPDDRGAVLDLYRQALTTHSARSIEYRLLRHDGEFRWMLGNLAPRLQPNGAFVGLIGTCIDMTEQKLIRDQLQRSEERLALAIHGSSHIVWDLNLVTREAFCSEQLAGLLGYEPAAIPTTAEGLAGLLPEEDRAAATTLFQQHLAGDCEYDFEHRALHRDGGHRWFRSRGSVMRDPTGQPIRFAGISIDITEAREQQEALRRYAADLEASKRRIEQQAAELQVASEQAAASSRTKSEFLANMSHEIRTPLNSVLGLTQLVLDSDLSADHRKLLKTVHDSGEHLLTIINDILDFSKMEAHKLQLDPIVFRLEDCLEQSLAMLRQRAVEGALTLERQAAA